MYRENLGTRSMVSKLNGVYLHLWIAWDIVSGTVIVTDRKIHQ